MSTSPERRNAAQLYDSGHALFLQSLYNEALIELQHASDAFRAIDAQGHPFSRSLSNGVSGLANSLALSGLCCQKLGNYKKALLCYETSLINEKFENKQAFQAFKRSLKDNMTACYYAVTISMDTAERDKLLDRATEIDISFQFPYSLPPDVIAFARLYELLPARFGQYENFYRNVSKQDAELRRQSKTSDESTMKRMAIYVWTVLVTIWVVYGVIAIEAVVTN
jgi:tetratricopeptide (TPR) repeat protein